ncbi:hypothetical protein CYY_006065 [Polysphondylium violaceum]|uniref:F-box domain-containing protein n=1 Tax=Polysphondylium violaceum TaxID=133409 RepID=A0A8J4PSB9_9MYCE|nr:hypothetical protein CYY_006065 [Polysphondylium violaceum]
MPISSTSRFRKHSISNNNSNNNNNNKTTTTTTTTSTTSTNFNSLPVVEINNIDSILNKSNSSSSLSNFSIPKIQIPIETDQNNNNNNNNNSNNNNGNKSPRTIPKLNLLKINNSNNNINNSSNNLNNSNNSNEQEQSPRYLGLKILFSTSPRPVTPRNHSPRNSNNSQSQNQIIYNLQHLPQHLLEDIFYYVLDSILPSLLYTDLCTVSKSITKVIENMKGFVLIIGINESQSKLAIQWYQKHFRQVYKIKFVNQFFSNQELSRQFLDVYRSIEHDPSLDLSDNFINSDLLNAIAEKLKINRIMTYLNLSRTTFNLSQIQQQLENQNNNQQQQQQQQIININNIKEPIEESIIQQKDIDYLLKSLSLNSSLEVLEMNSCILSNKLQTLPLIPDSINNTSSGSLYYLDLGGMNLRLAVAIKLAEVLKSNSTITTLIYNNNSEGLDHIFKSITANTTLSNLNFSECSAFVSYENIEAFQIMIRTNPVIKYLDISKNLFADQNNSVSCIFSAFTANKGITYLNLSSLSSTVNNQAINIFPYLYQIYSTNKNIKSLIIPNNYFPEPTVYCSTDFLSIGNVITNLDLANLRLGDTKFIPIINSLTKYQKSNIIKLNLSINRLRKQSAIEIAKYLEKNDTLEELNLGFNFLREGVSLICNSLIENNNTVLKSLKLFATQIRNKEAKSIAKLLSVNKSIQELDIGLNIAIDPILHSLESNQSLTTLHVCFSSLKAPFLRLLQKNNNITNIDVSNSSFSTWKSTNLVNLLIKNKTISKINFSTEDGPNIFSKNSKMKIRVFPSKLYHFK